MFDDVSWQRWAAIATVLGAGIPYCWQAMKHLSSLPKIEKKLSALRQTDLRHSRQFRRHGARIVTVETRVNDHQEKIDRHQEKIDQLLGHEHPRAD